MVSQDDKYAVETVSLTRIFPDWWGRAKVVAVQDLNMQVRYNEIYGLLGPNGSGKTTTLKILLNLLYPTKGHAFVLGGSCSDAKTSARIGYLPEESYLYRYLTARETLDFYGRIFGLPSSIRKARIESLLEMVGLSAMANRPVGTYSKGMARRIGLAQALINDPELLILDEPTSGMDPIGTRQIKDLIVHLARRGKTILLCSHLLADVEDVCDRIGILYGGRMQVEGPVDSLLKHTDQTQILTSGLSEDVIGKIRRIIKENGGGCEISTPMDRLEDYFIRTVETAQEQMQPTSGAISTRQIGGFLAEEDKPAELLKKLVSAPDVPAKATVADISTEAVQKAELSVGRKNELLDKLTKESAEGVKTMPVKKQAPAAANRISSEDVDMNLLEKLTGRDDSGGKTQRQSDKAQSGDTTNA